MSSAEPQASFRIEKIDMRRVDPNVTPGARFHVAHGAALGDQPLPVVGHEMHVGHAAKMLYEILVEFYELLKKNPEIGPKLLQSNLCVQFRYKNPSAVITIDATGDDLKIVQGEFDGQPEVVLTMNADFAHAFWHGKANLVSALTRRQVKAKGNVPKTIKLLPILKPSYALYPKFLADKGLRHLVMH